MNVFSLTKTLDRYVDFYIDDPAEAEVIVVGGSYIDLSLYPKLKYIFKCGVGVNNIPNDLKERGVELVMPSDHTRHAIYDEVSSFTVHLILNSHYTNDSDMGTWTKVERDDLYGKKILVVGVGNIGEMVHDKLSLLFRNIEKYDIKYEDSRPLEECVKGADIITLHCPLTKDNAGMIKMDWLKDDVILVNTARAELVDENDLYNFLVEHPKAKASFDVFWKEPYSGKLVGVPNFVGTPHVASFGKSFKLNLFRDLEMLLGR